MRTKNNAPSAVKRLNSLILVAVLSILAAIVAVPWHSAQSSSLQKVAASPKQPSWRGIPLGTDTKNRFLTGASLGLSLSPFALFPDPETIATYASDCTTPRTSFVLGETVCAKTDNVDLNYPGGRWVDWILTGNPTVIVSGSRNTTLITMNPQTFTFTPAVTGTYKASITQDDNGLDNPQTSAVFTVDVAPPVATWGYDTNTNTCTFPRANFILGETVCVKVEGLAVNATFPNKIAWGDTEGLIRQKTDIDSDPEQDTFLLPSTPTSLVFGGITVDNRGTWRVNVTRNNGRRINFADFTVSDPAEPLAVVFVRRSRRSDAAVSPGGSVAVVVIVGNNGPDTALNVNLVDSPPSGATLNSFTQQSGPSCVQAQMGSADCSIATLTNGGRAELTFVYDMGNATGTFPTSATVSSDQTDSDATDNSATTEIRVVTGGGGGTTTCTVSCPDDITTPANTHEDPNDPNSTPGAIVHFSPPSGNPECGTITADHCNDCFFPEGTTTVTATASTGDFCSFTVTVTPAGSAPTISCPGNKTADADANVCSTNVNVGTATATGSNVTVIGFRSDGQPMYTCDAFGNCTRNSSDAPFNAGTTTITWYAYSHDIPGPYGTSTCDQNGENCDEESHRNGSATCTQTVMVNDVTPPTIGATDSTVSADENCEAVIPDYSSTVTDNCACGSSDTSDACQGHPHIVYTQTPAAGTVVGLGPHNVHIEATDGSSNNNGATKDVTFTVNDTTPPMITCPANIETTTDPGTCSAAVDPGTATATDNCDSSPTITGTRSDSQPLNAPYPKGTTTITWRATDDAGNYSECTQTVTVADDEAPVITFNGQTPSMWPPNHAYRTFTPADFISSVSDNCDSLSVSDVYITSVTSDEAEDDPLLGDGTTLNDIVIASDCKSVQVRAERVNNGNGRVYTIYFKLKDSSGNFTTGSAKVYSPKNQGDTPGNDAVQYTVTSSCP